MPVERAVHMLALHFNRFAVDHPRISAPVIPAGVRTNVAVALAVAKGKLITPAEADRLSIAMKELKEVLARSEQFFMFSLSVCFWTVLTDVYILHYILSIVSLCVYMCWC